MSDIMAAKHKSLTSGSQTARPARMQAFVEMLLYDDEPNASLKAAAEIFFGLDKPEVSEGNGGLPYKI